MARILVVEDDPMLLQLYASLLKDSGYIVNKAQNGQIGLNKMQKGGYDLVLLDIMLPKIDGLEILQRLKKTPPKKPNKKIVLLTNLGHDEVIKQGFKLGADGFLTKSDLDPGQLLQEIKKFLGSA